MKPGLRKGRGTKAQIASISWITEKAKEFQKNICFIDYIKAFDGVDHNKLENSSRDGCTRPPYLSPEKFVCRSRSNSQNWTWNNRLVQNWEEYVNVVCYHPAYLILYAEYIMQNAGLDEAYISWNQDCWEKYQ